ncbi:MAG: GatB/YqeY domain-containing protein [Oligoflexia bacterium]|nr:GatB/YqeY domain-containing protein [Oligoflexia bacterium]
MSLVDEITAQIKTAMRAKDKPRLTALRSIRAAFILGMKENGSDTLPEDRALDLIRRLAKQRRDSIAEYTKAGRTDLSQVEEAELAVINEFLPTLADEPTTLAWVEQAVAATGASSVRDMGKVMGRLMGAHKAEIDGTLASKLVRQVLG